MPILNFKFLSECPPLQEYSPLVNKPDGLLTKNKVGKKNRVIFGSSRSEEKTSTTKELQKWLEITTFFSIGSHMGVSKNGRKPPKWMVYFMENPIKHGMIWRYHYFWKHPHVHYSLVYAVVFKPTILFPDFGWRLVLYNDPLFIVKILSKPLWNTSPFLFFCLRQSLKIKKKHVGI